MIGYVEDFGAYEMSLTLITVSNYFLNCSKLIRFDLLIFYIALTIC
jgi:hypothetical protein